jgi:hypothetical protein
MSKSTYDENRTMTHTILLPPPRFTKANKLTTSEDEVLEEEHQDLADGLQAPSRTKQVGLFQGNLLHTINLMDSITY